MFTCFRSLRTTNNKQQTAFLPRRHLGHEDARIDLDSQCFRVYERTTYLPFVISTKPAESGARRDLRYVFTFFRSLRTTYNKQQTAFLPRRHLGHEETLRIDTGSCVCMCFRVLVFPCLRANSEQRTAYIPFVISTKPTESGARRDLR